MSTNPSVDPHGNADRYGKQRRYDCKFERRRKPLGDKIEYRLLHLIGDAEVEVQNLPNKAAELQGDRIVETELRAEFEPILEARVLTHQLVDRIADETKK